MVSAFFFTWKRFLVFVKVVIFNQTCIKLDLLVWANFYLGFLALLPNKRRGRFPECPFPGMTFPEMTFLSALSTPSPLYARLATPRLSGAQGSNALPCFTCVV